MYFLKFLYIVKVYNIGKENRLVWKYVPLEGKKSSETEGLFYFASTQEAAKKVISLRNQVIFGDALWRVRLSLVGGKNNEKTRITVYYKNKTTLTNTYYVHSHDLYIGVKVQ